MKNLLLIITILGWGLITQAQVTKNLTLNAGELSTLLTSDEKNTVTDLTLSGTIDARDFKCMRDEMLLLANLDLSGVSIAEYIGEEGTYPYGDNNELYQANEVPRYAFFSTTGELENTSLLSVILPNSIKKIKELAFAFCSNLSNIILGDDLQLIENSAFTDCINLGSVILPDSVEIINPGSFTHTLIEVSAENPYFSAIEGVLFNKQQTSLILCPSSIKTGTYTVPYSVETIEPNAFGYCEQLTEIILPEGLTVIKYGAFRGCTQLTVITIPSTVITIERYAFWVVRNLQSITVLNTTPVDLSQQSDVFYGVNKASCTLNVPFFTKDAYQAAALWQDFNNIVEAPNGFFVETKQFEVNHMQNSVFVNIEANVEWTASCPDSWVTFYPVSPSGNGTSEISIEANSNESMRSTSIEISSTGYPSQYINVKQEGKVFQLIISEARIDAADHVYIELTNMDNQAIDLSAIEIGQITPYNSPYFPNDNQKMRLPSQLLMPGESYLIASVFDYAEERYQRDPEEYINYRRRTKKEFWSLADLQIHYYEDSFNDPSDSVSASNELFGLWNGRSCIYIRQFINDSTSKVIDQVGGVFDNQGRNYETPYNVAGYTDATFQATLVRKYSVKTGNLDFANGRGSTPENSEWIVLPHLHASFEPERALFWTAGNHGNYELNEQSINSSVLQIDWNSNTITAPWGIRNNDDFAKAIDKAPGIAWHYQLADSDLDKAFASARTGDRFTLYACGNERQSRSFDIVVSPPVASDNLVLPKFRSNKNGSFPTSINGGLGEVFEVTRYETGMDSITKGSIGIPFATRVDTLFKYLEKPANASWEIIWNNGTPRSDLMDGDLLRVTAENGAVKDYYIKVNSYQTNDNAELAAISWPDIPQHYYNLNGWNEDVIPGFVKTKFSYQLTIPSEINAVPALIAETSSLNATVSINRAKNLYGSEADRTTTFTVTAENGTETRVYKVIFVKEKAPEDLQPNTSEPFFSQIVCRENWANSFIEIYNPGNQVLDLSRYMIVRTVFADPFNAVLESALPTTFDYRFKRYVPGYIWTEDPTEWSNNPGVLYPDLQVNAIVQPGDVFVLAKCNTTMNNGQTHPRYNEADVNFLAGHDPWGYNLADNQYVAYGWTNETYYLYKILNDSVLDGTKALTDPYDVVLLDVFGRGNGENWGMVDGTQTGQNSGFKRLTSIQEGNIEPGASLGTGDPNTSEWIYTNIDYWNNEGYSWPYNEVQNSDGIGYHDMDASTIYSSTVSAAIYQVSDGYSMNESIRIVKTGTTVNAFLDQIIRHDPAQQLSVLSAADESVLGGEALLQNNDALLVVSADGKNSTKYFIEVDATGLSSNSILTSTLYNVVFGDTSVYINGFDYETTIRNVLNNVNIPAGATLTVINSNDEPVPIQKRNSDGSTTDLKVNHDIYFEVLAEDRINTIVYQLLPQSNESVFVTSAIYGVDQYGSLIKFIDKGVAVEAFLNNLLPSQGAVMQVIDKNGYPRNLGVLATDDRLLVTAADGVTTKTYRLYFVGDDLPAFTPGGFDEYSVGDYLAVVDDAWTTWDGIHGGNYDGLITSENAYSQPNSVKVEGQTGLIFPMGNRTSGRWQLTFQVFLPVDKVGYFHVEHDDTPGGELGVECFFNTNGNGYINAAGQQFSFDFNTTWWFEIKLIFDIDNDISTIFINGVEKVWWQWSKSIDGTDGLKQLGCLNMYANTANGIPEMYFDDVEFKSLESIHNSNIGLVGTFNGWGASADVPLVQDTSNPYEWSLVYNFAESTEVKFRGNQDWAINWGNSGFPSDYAYQDGSNIQVPAGAYLIQFNAYTGYYSFTAKAPLVLQHSYTFEDGTAADVVGEAHGTVAGGTIDNGIYSANNQGSDFIELPAADIAINTYGAITFEAYVETGEMLNDGWTHMSYFGDSVNGFGANSIFISLARSDDNSRTAITCLNENEPWNNETGIFGPELESAALHHVVTTIDATSIKFYIDGQMHGEAQLSADNSISNLSNNYAWLCKGGYANDPTWLGKIYEYNIYSGVMLQGEISQKAQNFLSSNLFASFESSVRETTPGNTINFTDQSLGNPTAWVWDFGDGGSSTEQHPSHMYQSEGVYTVTLTVNNGTVSHTTVKEQLITVNSPISIELLTISSPVRMPNATHHCATNYEYPIEIKLVNKGQTAVSDLVVVNLIDDVEMGRETITTSINVGDTLAHQFSGNVNFYTNNYHRRFKIECRVEIADIDEADNGKLMYFNVFGEYHDAENWTTYNSCDGMISDISFAIAEDKNGNIWSTCFYGASRYNGTSWEKLTTNEGLNENYSWAILNDHLGNIWFAGSGSDTITRFDGSNFTYYPQPHIFEECIHEDAQGRLWFGAYQAQGIAMFNGSTWTYFLSTEVDFGSNIQSIGSDINGNFFVSCYDSETSTPFVKMYNGTTWSDFVIPGNGYIISEIFLDTSGKTWFTASNGTFYNYDGSNWQVLTSEDIGVNMYCNDISEDPWGNVWFGGNHDVVAFNGSGFEHHFVPADGLAAATSHEVYAVYADSEGYLWIGTYAGGISVYNLNALHPSQQHFNTVWSGNGTDHMNFNVVTAKIDGVDLVAGDEIGLFDGNLCVGAGVLTSTASASNIFSMVASADDGSGNGYSDGSDIVYKLYKRSVDKEFTNITVNYRTDMPGWVTDGKYEINGTAVIEIEATSNITQNIPLNSGWNIISSMVTPEQADIKVLLQTLIDQGKLRKVMDETGNSLEDLGSFLGGWKNNIGDLLQTEGYKVNVTENCAISLEGAPVSIPLSIPLNAGWNIISFPASGNQDGKAVVQSLIDAGKLKKAMNETGLSIEDLGSFLGGWKNNIGDFVPGKGYKINVNTACELVLSNDLSKSAVVVPELLASDYFKPVFTGNGTDHMNINLIHLTESGIIEGDEIGIFDGSLCVGSAKVGAAQIKEDYISIPASMNDGLAQKPNGYSEGNSIHLSIYRNGEEAALNYELLKGESRFAKGESMIAKASGWQAVSAHKIGYSAVNASFYPNPFNESIHIDLIIEQSQNLDVTVFDLYGRKIKTLFRGRADGKLQLQWQGKNEQGQAVRGGLYLCRVNGITYKMVKN